MRELIVKLIIKSQEAINKLKQDLERVEQAGINASKSFSTSFLNGLSSLKNGIISFFTSAGGIISTVLGGAVSSLFKRTIDDVDSSIKKLTAFFDETTARAYFEYLKNVAVETNMQTSALVDTFLQLNAVFNNPAGAIKFTENLYRITDALGLSEREAQQFINTLTYSLTTGELDSRRLATLLRENASLVAILGKAWGITTEEILAGLENGSITLGDFIQKLQEIDPSKIQSIGTTFEGWAGIWQQITYLISEVADILGIQETIKQALTFIKNALRENEEKIKRFVAGVQELGKWIVPVYTGFRLISNIIKNLVNEFKPELQVIGKLVISLLNGVKTLATGITNFISGIFQNLIEVIRRVISTILTILERIPFGEKIATAFRKGLEILAKTPFVRSAKAISQGVLDTYNEISQSIQKTLKSQPKPKFEIEGELKLKLKTKTETGVEGAGIPSFQFKPETIQAAYQEKLQRLVSSIEEENRKQLEGLASRVPELQFADAFIYQLQQQLQPSTLQNMGERLGVALSQGIGEGFEVGTREMLIPLMLQSLTQTLVMLQPQLAPIIALVGGILQGLLSQLLTPSPELEATVQKATEIKQEINIYINRADISDKGFWEDLILNKINPAFKRLETKKQGWGV